IDKLDLAVLIDAVGEIGHRAIQRHGDRALGERWGNAFGNIKPGCASGIISLGAVRKGEGNGSGFFLRGRSARAGFGHNDLLAHSLPTNAGKLAADIAGESANAIGRWRLARAPPAAIAPGLPPAGARWQE